MKRTIRLTESELRRLIAESVKMVIREGTIDDIKDMHRKRPKYPFIDDDEDYDDEIEMGVL